MAAFQYIAVDENGKHNKGVLEADTARQVRQLLRERGLLSLEVRAVAEEEKTKIKSAKFSFKFRPRMSSQDLTLITRQMNTLLSAGIPLDETLTGVANQTEKSSVKSILLGVRAKVMEGHSLAVGMGEFPSAFPRLYRTTIDAGEKSGKLDHVLERLAEYTEKQQQIKRKIQQALIYPILMMMVSISVIIFMLIYVVPKIIQVFNQTDQVLPFITTVLLAVSGFIQHDGIYLLGGLVLAAFFGARLLKRENIRRRLDGWLLRTPLIGKVIKTINSARFARTFGILNSASVPVLEGMHAAAQLIGPLPIREAVMEAISQVREGSSIHGSLQKTHYFSPMFIHLLGSGEASGNLDGMLQKVAMNQESEVEAVIDGVLTLFEPLMILVMGSIVLFIVLAVMLPIFALDNFNG